MLLFHYLIIFIALEKVRINHDWKLIIFGDNKPNTIYSDIAEQAAISIQHGNTKTTL